jgi:hypothetical protein
MVGNLYGQVPLVVGSSFPRTTSKICRRTGHMSMPVSAGSVSVRAANERRVAT